MTTQEFDLLTFLSKNIDKDWDKLSEWERRFCEDTLERFRQYGKMTRISPKQKEIIARICGKVG